MELRHLRCFLAVPHLEVGPAKLVHAESAILSSIALYVVGGARIFSIELINYPPDTLFADIRNGLVSRLVRLRLLATWLRQLNHDEFPFAVVLFVKVNHSMRGRAGTRKEIENN